MKKLPDEPPDPDKKTQQSVRLKHFKLMDNLIKQHKVPKGKLLLQKDKSMTALCSKKLSRNNNLNF